MSAYDRKVWANAHVKFMTNPASLTDDEIAQLELTSPDIGDRARARRSGYVEPKPTDAEAKRFNKTAITGFVFLKWVEDFLAPIFDAYRYRLDDLERQIRERPAGGVDYKGIWSDSQLYPAGCFVTHAGSMWFSKAASVSRRPGTDPGAWQLAVKRGSDGKDAV